MTTSRSSNACSPADASSGAASTLAILVTGGVAVSGMASNVRLDRLGLHFFTAPGSARGAMDSIHIGRYFYNVADLMIMTGTSLFAHCSS